MLHLWSELVPTALFMSLWPELVPLALFTVCLGPELVPIALFMMCLWPVLVPTALFTMCLWPELIPTALFVARVSSHSTYSTVHDVLDAGMHGGTTLRSCRLAGPRMEMCLALVTLICGLMRSRSAVCIAQCLYKVWSRSAVCIAQCLYKVWLWLWVYLCKLQLMDSP